MGVVDLDLLTEYATTREPALRDQLAVQHLPLVKFVARRMSGSLPTHIELDDLISWGCLGLLAAIDKFEPERGLKFSTYAVTRIRGSILDGLQKMDWAPKQVTSKVRQLKRAKEALWHDLGREPTGAELADVLGMTEDEVRSIQVDAIQQMRKVYVASEAGDSDDPLDHLSEDAHQEVAGEVAEIQRRVAAAVARLEEREQEVFLLYYREGMTLREVAGTLGISASSAIQTHTRLVESVRGWLAGMGGVETAGGAPPH